MKPTDELTDLDWLAVAKRAAKLRQKFGHPIADHQTREAYHIACSAFENAVLRFNLEPEEASQYRAIWKRDTLEMLGRTRCLSIDHNEPNGCSNPDCFKFTEVKL